MGERAWEHAWAGRALKGREGCGRLLKGVQRLTSQATCNKHRGETNLVKNRTPNCTNLNK